MRRGFGLYVHWPFCQAKCPYCDFNSHVSSSVDQDRWREAFSREIARISEDLPGRELTSIFFGGGTPSLMEPATVETVIDAAAKTWPMAENVEITLEANPTSVEAERFRAYANSGVNRVSIGIQALNDPDLRALGRLHSVAEARAAYDTARRTFPRVSFDLIYARQNQTLTAWETELAEALSLAADHVSLYQLTIEPETVFGRRHAVGKLPGLPDEDVAADMFELTQAMTEAAGLPAYEISNHARPGAESRHNLTYWRAHDWLGIGPGAHGRFTAEGVRISTETPLGPADWLKAVSQGNGESLRRKVDTLEAGEEAVMMGLRLAEGVQIPQGYMSEISSLEADGLLRNKSDRVFLTAKGRPLLDAILRQILV
jgi:oxygen-independent coproporphyrinogen-3 oxidase